MAGIKTVLAHMTMGPKFAMEGMIGNHVVRIDQPRGAGGEDTGPTPLEYLLVSLAGCYGAIGRIIANQKRLPLQGMEVRVAGELNVDVLLGKSKEPRAGFTSIKVTVRIDGDMPFDEKRKLLHEIEERCPISDNVVNTTSLAVELVE